LAPEQLEPIRERLSQDFSSIRPRLPGPPARISSIHPAFRSILTRNSQLIEVLKSAERLAPWNQLNLLILGEPGVGKELLASAIHKASGRMGRLVALDMQSRAENLVEDDLFGHEAGAYSGSRGSRLGAAREAQGGTLFLDEIGNLPLALQSKLLRLVEAREVQPLGTDRPVPVDVRVVAATNADLKTMVRRGEFRADLLERLASRILQIPPLRDRPEDILLLCEWMLAQVCQQHQVPAPHISPEAAEILLSAPWPGNIRQLKNIMASAAAECEGEVIRPEHLGPLAPQNNRPIPMIFTRSTSNPGLIEPELLARLEGIRLVLPAFRERPRAIRRFLLLSLLEGRVMRESVLLALEDRPWWGNFQEISRIMATLCASIKGPIDSRSVEQCLPMLLSPEDSAPIVVLLYPAASGDGSVVGLEQQFIGPVLVVGHAGGSLAELELLAKQDGRVRARLLTLNKYIVGQEPEFLALSSWKKLGRARIVIRSTGRGLQALDLGGSGELKGGPLEGGSRKVLGTSWVELGAAGELAAEDSSYRLFVFSGQAARKQAEGLVLARLGGGGEATLIGNERGEEPDARRGRWKLSAYEAALLNASIISWLDSGEDFTRFIQRMLKIWGADEQSQRLSEYFDCPEPPKYAGRLFALSANEDLRADLRQRLEAVPGGMSRLPAPLLRAIG
jgi:DNA-binding NtrC family response regulator